MFYLFFFFCRSEKESVCGVWRDYVSISNRVYHTFVAAATLTLTSPIQSIIFIRNAFIAHNAILIYMWWCAEICAICDRFLIDFRCRSISAICTWNSNQIEIRITTIRCRFGLINLSVNHYSGIIQGTGACKQRKCRTTNTMWHNTNAYLDVVCEARGHTMRHKHTHTHTHAQRIGMFTCVH